MVAFLNGWNGEVLGKIKCMYVFCKMYWTNQYHKLTVLQHNISNMSWNFYHQWLNISKLSHTQTNGYQWSHNLRASEVDLLVEVIMELRPALFLHRVLYSLDSQRNYGNQAWNVILGSS